MASVLRYMVPCVELEVQLEGFQEIQCADCAGVCRKIGSLLTVRRQGFQIMFQQPANTTDSSRSWAAEVQVASLKDADVGRCRVRRQSLPYGECRYSSSRSEHVTVAHLSRRLQVRVCTHFLLLDHHLGVIASRVYGFSCNYTLSILVLLMTIGCLYHGTSAKLV